MQKALAGRRWSPEAATGSLPMIENNQPVFVKESSGYEKSLLPIFGERQRSNLQAE
jgi:hypothetical protein